MIATATGSGDGVLSSAETTFSCNADGSCPTEEECNLVSLVTSTCTAAATDAPVAATPAPVAGGSGRPGSGGPGSGGPGSGGPGTVISGAGDGVDGSINVPDEGDETVETVPPTSAPVAAPTSGAGRPAATLAAAAAAIAWAILA